MPRQIFFVFLAALVGAAIYSFVAIGHSYPSLGIAIVVGLAAGFLNRPGNRQRAPRVAGAILFLLGVALSHRFAGVPGTGPHRLAFDVQFFATFLIAAILVRRFRRLAG